MNAVARHMVSHPIRLLVYAHPAGVIRPSLPAPRNTSGNITAMVLQCVECHRPFLASELTAINMEPDGALSGVVLYRYACPLCRTRANIFATLEPLPGEPATAFEQRRVQWSRSFCLLSANGLAPPA
jgi:hypothetical protein